MMVWPVTQREGTWLIFPPQGSQVKAKDLQSYG
jgi:hypothetical protein